MYSIYDHISDVYQAITRSAVHIILALYMEKKLLFPVVYGVPDLEPVTLNILTLLITSP